jgi:DHA2 family multidrug resistance protein-like MFS transporter
VQQALRNAGAPLGSAILGSVLAAAYVSRLSLAGLSPAAAHAARAGVFGGVAAARALNSPSLLASVRAAFVHGLDVALPVSLGFAAAGIALTLIFMPARAGPPAGGAQPATARRRARCRRAPSLRPVRRSMVIG